MTLLRMAASYRHSADLLRVRMIALKEQARTAPPAERSKLEQRIRDPVSYTHLRAHET